MDLKLDHDILRDPKSVDFNRAVNLAKLQLGAADRVLATQTRVDETKLRRGQIDILPKLLAIVMEEKKALGMVIEGEAVEERPG